MIFILNQCLYGMSCLQYEQDINCIHFKNEIEKIIPVLNDLERSIIKTRVNIYIQQLSSERGFKYLDDDFEIECAIEQMQQVKKLLEEKNV